MKNSKDLVVGNFLIQKLESVLLMVEKGPALCGIFPSSGEAVEADTVGGLDHVHGGGAEDEVCLLLEEVLQLVEEATELVLFVAEPVLEFEHLRGRSIGGGGRCVLDAGL